MNNLLKHLAFPAEIISQIEIVKGKGVYLYDKNGKEYLDLNSGICVNNLGHCHPAVIDAVKLQIEKYSHVTVYGESIQQPQMQLAEILAGLLPSNLNCSFFVSTGSEAVEGALKLAKRYTGRTEIIAFKNSYHGSTHGALSVMGEEGHKRAFRPLLSNVKLLDFNCEKSLNEISEKTACVIIEPIQGEAGVILSENLFLKKLRQRSNETGALLLFDEVQTGMGRTGTLFAFEQYDVVPDVLILAKALGGGLPLGVFISSKNIMDCLKTEPLLGHITTFGGNPVCCAAAIAAIQTLLKEKLIDDILSKELLFKKLLKHNKIKEIRGKGLMLALDFGDQDFCQRMINSCLENGLFLDSFLFSPQCIRISPPLIISEKEIEKACSLILSSIKNII